MTDTKWLAPILDNLRISGIWARLYHCAPGWSTPLRVIADDMFYYIIRGSGCMTIDGRRTLLEPGLCAHFRRQVPHSVSHDPKKPLVLLAIHYTASVFESLTLAELAGFPDAFTISRDEWFIKTLHELHNEETQQPIGHKLVTEALILRLLLHLFRTDDYRTQMRPEYSGARLDDLVRLQPALTHLRAHLSDPESLSDLSRHCGLSSAQFRRIFVRTLRITPVQYQRRIRIEHACTFLRNSTLTLEAISAEVGYTEPAFFARTFKQLMGLPPGQFRKLKEP